MKNGKLLAALVFVGVGLAAGGAYYVVNTQRMKGPRYDRLLPQVKDLLQQHLAAAAQAGLDVMFFEGWRSPEDEQAEIARGASHLKDPLDTFHVWGAAYDLAFRNRAGLPEWPPDDDPRWKQLEQLGESAGMFSGGVHWGWDLGHFEWHGVSVPDLRQQYGADYQVFLTDNGVMIA